MKYFKATFSRWINAEEPVFDNQQKEVSEWAARKEMFYIKQVSFEAAREYRKTFEGIETNAYEGLAQLEALEEISEEDAKQYLNDLSIYESYKPPARRRN